MPGSFGSGDEGYGSGSFDHDDHRGSYGSDSPSGSFGSSGFDGGGYGSGSFDHDDHHGSYGCVDAPSSVIKSVTFGYAHGCDDAKLVDFKWAEKEASFYCCKFRSVSGMPGSFGSGDEGYGSGSFDHDDHHGSYGSDSPSGSFGSDGPYASYGWGSFGSDRSGAGYGSDGFERFPALEEARHTCTNQKNPDQVQNQVTLKFGEVMANFAKMKAYIEELKATGNQVCLCI